MNIDKDLNIILNKINERIFNAAIPNGDLIRDISPEQFITEDKIIENNNDLLLSDPTSESQDMASYVASASPPIITIHSDIFSSKK